jgi:hypothetical protein
MLFVLGCLLILLGIASLFIPIPRREKHGVNIGRVSLGVETTTREKVHPVISGSLIVAGALLMLVDRKRKG